MCIILRFQVSKCSCGWDKASIQLAPLWLFLVCCGRIDLGSTCACGQSGITNNRWNGAADCKDWNWKAPVQFHTPLLSAWARAWRLCDCRVWQVALEQHFLSCSVTWKQDRKCCFYSASVFGCLFSFCCCLVVLWGFFFFFERSMNFKIWYNYKYWPKDVFLGCQKLGRSQVRCHTPVIPALWR